MTVRRTSRVESSWSSTPTDSGSRSVSDIGRCLADTPHGLATEIDAMKFFYSPGTSSQLVHIVLRESDLVFEPIRVDEHTKAMGKGAGYRTIDPLGYAPAVQLDDGTIRTEGVAIVQYLADKVPAKRLLSPNGTLERSKLQSWLKLLVGRGACGMLLSAVPLRYSGGGQSHLS